MTQSQRIQLAHTYEIAALTSAACAVLGVGAGMIARQPGIGAVLGAGVGLMVRAGTVALRARNT